MGYSKEFSKPSLVIWYISLLCIIIFILSTIAICISAILLEFHAMFYLKYWSETFRIAPCLALALGIFCVIVTIFGFCTSGYEYRGLLVLFAILLIFAFILQIVAIFVFLEVKSFIDQRLEDNNLNDFEKSLFDLYGMNDYATTSWDVIQEKYKCCGASGPGAAYRNWYQNQEVGDLNVPDSCCVTKTPNCGMHIGHKEEVKGLIFTSSCDQMLQSDMENEVVPMIYVYCAMGVLLLLTEIILIFLIIFLIFQITKRKSKQRKLLDQTFSTQV